MKLAILFTACLFASSNAFASVEKKEFSNDGLQSLNVSNPWGIVKISATSGDKAAVTAEKIKFGKNCTLNMDKSGSKLVVEVKSNDSEHGNCEVNFEIQVPKKVALNLKTGLGGIQVQGTRGTIDLEIGAGDTNIKAEVEALSAKTGSGSVDASGLQGNATVETGTGTVALSYADIVAKGKVDIKTGTGNATVSLPEKMKIRTSFTSPLGKLTNELGDTSGADFKVSMKSGTGGLTIKKQ